jgi:glycosyltransferase involved in cell wall biosynthesis
MPVEHLQERTRLGPPGVDTRTFRPLGKEEAASELGSLVRWLQTAERTGFGAGAAEALDHLSDPSRERPPDGDALGAVRSQYDPAGIDVEAPARLTTIDPVVEPVVCFVGKLIISKGVDLLLAAWPLVLARNPRARLVIVGFGTYREGLEVLLRALEHADERLLSHLCRYGRALEGGPRDRLTYLSAFFERLSGRHERYFGAARRLRESVVFTGRLDHGELAKLLPAAEAMVVPSMFPEAFGMVAAEAAACGALPICAAHSGLAEAAALLGHGLPEDAQRLLTFERGMRAVDGIAHALNTWLALDAGARQDIRARLVRTAQERFGWDRVAEGVLAAAQGRLDLLEPPASVVPFTPAGGGIG